MAAEPVVDTGWARVHIALPQRPRVAPALLAGREGVA
jgi:hypothetical protein